MSLRFLAPSVAALVLALAGATRAAAAPAIAEGTLKDGVRTIELAVTSEGFEPARVKVSKGEKVRLLVTRKTDQTCATEIVIAEHGINAPLPLGKAVAVEFTPKKSGEFKYACGMGHITGVVFVK
jgi:plastocyanin domain-containing protein